MPGLDAVSITHARAVLAAADPALARADAATPAFPWRTRPGGYAGLLKILVNQQVSNASAAAIWSRLEAGLGQVTAANALRFDLDGLRAFGLSRPKARYVLAIAEAERRGDIRFDRLAALDDAAAMAALCALTGVGRWTAEVYLSFCEGRTDFFPAGDVALQEAVRLADRADQRLTERQLYQRAEAWRPHRGVAAHLLWAYYGGVRRGEIVPG